MDERDFIYWLKGYLEAVSFDEVDDIGESHLKTIEEHLRLLFDEKAKNHYREKVEGESVKEVLTETCKKKSCKKKKKRKTAKAKTDLEEVIVTVPSHPAPYPWVPGPPLPRPWRHHRRPWETIVTCSPKSRSYQLIC